MKTREGGEVQAFVPFRLPASSAFTVMLSQSLETMEARCPSLQPCPTAAAALHLTPMCSGSPIGHPWGCLWDLHSRNNSPVSALTTFSLQDLFCHPCCYCSGRALGHSSLPMAGSPLTAASVCSPTGLMICPISDLCSDSPTPSHPTPPGHHSPAFSFSWI